MLVGMLNEETKQKLVCTLDPEKQNEFFFYQNFNQQEKTDKNTQQFISSLITKYYEENNQNQPCARVEAGYVQCIKDPNVDEGFITVQIVEP